MIAEGYARMDKASFAAEEEPAITGELVRQMRRFLESTEAVPGWVCHYSIHDDPPLSVEGRRGKARPRVDIEFERVAIGARPRLRFEAKRLRSDAGHTVQRYLGTDGLGCFLSGKYPLTHGEAGMLGYVQSEDEGTWAGKIEAALNRDGATHAVVDPAFGLQRVCDSLPFTYISHHRMARRDEPVAIHHVFLGFGTGKDGSPSDCGP
jgi:hypothetical protein